ncbi:hypothetical protein [Providencia phage PSTCR6]|nr:hypothetical protein [Providencia phage PSTCR6]
MKELLLVIAFLSASAQAGYDQAKCDIYMSEPGESSTQMIKDDYKKITGHDIWDENDINGIGYSMYCNKNFDNSLLLKVYGDPDEQ